MVRTIRLVPATRPGGITRAMASDDERPEGDESYFEPDSKGLRRVFDASLLAEPLSVLPTKRPLILPPQASVTDAMRGMQAERTGCVLITEDGTADMPLSGIFTERDVLIRIVNQGQNPATLPLREVMTRDPEHLPREASIAWVLNKMAIGGFRHVPVVDEKDHPVLLVSVRDVVAFLVEFFPRDVLNLPHEYDASRPRTREGA